MKPNQFLSSMPASKILYAALLAAGTIATILLSPKWALPPIAWIAPALMLFYFRHATIRFRVLWFFMAVLAAGIISSYNVIPFPLPVMIVTSAIEAVKILLIYCVDRSIAKRYRQFAATLVLPAAFVTKEFFDASWAGGAWSSIANTQYGFHWLAQLSSVTGLAGISFLIYWFAASVVWCVERKLNGQSFKKGALIYASVFATVLLFGAVRYHFPVASHAAPVKIAGVTVPSFHVAESIYKDVNEKEVIINPKISVTSPQLQEVNTALVPFIVNPDTAKFRNGYKAIYALHDSLFALSKQAADKGAKIIAWSEGNAFMTRTMNDNFINRGKKFAAANNVYLLMAMAVFDSGAITPTTNFLENKTVFIAPDGNVLNVFHKNYPVPFAEHSKPGDGAIPVIKTPYGNISPSICYDADIPKSMRQLSANKTDLLLLPSGDWYSIAPYHSYMAAFRGIENGTAIMRQASGGLSLLTDYRGKTLQAFDFYTPGEKIWTASISAAHVVTIYSVIGDAFAYTCILFFTAAIISIVVKAIAARLMKRKKVMNKSLAAAEMEY